VSPKKQTPSRLNERKFGKTSKSNQELKAEIETWRVISQKMIGSYRDLNDRLKNLQNTKDKTKKVILDLTEEVKDFFFPCKNFCRSKV